MKKTTANDSIRLHISKGNQKLGNIPNISLTPGRTCSPEACRTCLKDGCYACKSYRQYPTVRKAWDENTTLATVDLSAMECALNAYFGALSAPRFFRIHVGGDFVSAGYADMWYRIAVAHPHTVFFGYTKQFDNIRPVAFETLPNFNLYLSDWPGSDLPQDLIDRGFPVAWLDDGSRPADTFPEDVFVCPGDCSHCAHCATSGKDVLFKKH